jgi:hypothetical protein
MRAIGGYFGLELNRHDEYHDQAIRLNTGRNALEYLLLAGQYQKIYLPYYTCDVLLEPIKRLGVAYEFYNIDEQLESTFDVAKIGREECFLYNNYFGMKDEFISSLQANCKNLIVDNVHAFYAKPLQDIDTFYSPRKFFGVTDGAYLYSNKNISLRLDKDTSHHRYEHLLRRLDISAEDGYPYFVQNEQSLSDRPILEMSNLTHQILKSIDYAAVAIIRKENYDYLDRALVNFNQFPLKLSSQQVPMTYPFYTEDLSLRKRLNEYGLYTAQYWQNVLELVTPETVEWRLTSYLIHLPIDQRYSQKELNKIINIITHEYHR